MLNDITYACAFVIGFVLLVAFIGFHIYALIYSALISQELSQALDSIWSAFLLCLDVMLGGKMARYKDGE